ncbi:hypothetical protein F4803DRAFT_27061 [Xylaria telfairii]|nr:hypothetical protein F4803DRAFT_27061 [Xylaria telfairii]
MTATRISGTDEWTAVGSGRTRIGQARGVWQSRLAFTLPSTTPCCSSDSSSPCRRISHPLQRQTQWTRTDGKRYGKCATGRLNWQPTADEQRADEQKRALDRASLQRLALRALQYRRAGGHFDALAKGEGAKKTKKEELAVEGLARGRRGLGGLDGLDGRARESGSSFHDVGSRLPAKKREQRDSTTNNTNHKQPSTIIKKNYC